MSDTVPFGQWVKQRRKEMDLTQEDLAERVGCSIWTIQKIELGGRRPSKQVAARLAECLQVPPEEHQAFTKTARVGVQAHTWPDQSPTAGDLSPAEAGRHNLPSPLTPLIGRAEALGAILEQLAGGERRLLTLTGPPGTGKTRLAVEAGHKLLEGFPDGVWFVALSTVVEPDDVASAVANALGIPHASSRSLVPDLRHYLQGRHLLLVLDNFEQVLDAAPMVLDLLSTCPDLRVLVTSREALHVPGEQQYHVLGLATPDPEELPPLEALMSYPAIELFMSRARAVKPDLVLTRANGAAVAEICARLEGLPLAIELAAARVNLFSPREIRTRLDKQLDLLHSEWKHLPSKQRNLRGAIEWSHRLLSDQEQILFARLGVFAGGCSFAAAEAVCNSKGDIGSGLPDVMASLVNKSLLQRRENEYGESHFWMLEMVREYSLERLGESGEEDSVRTLHAEYYLALAEVADVEVRRPEQKMWRQRLAEESDNVAGALAWMLKSGNTTMALRLGGSMEMFWYMSGRYTEPRRWLEEALVRDTGAQAGVRAKALLTLGRLADQNDDRERARQWFEDSLALYREIGDVAGIATVLKTLAFCAMLQGDSERAISLCNEALSYGVDSAARSESAKLLYVIGASALYAGDFVQARDFASRLVDLARKLEDKEILAAALNAAGLVAHYQGEYAQAEGLYRESLSIARQIGANQHAAHVTINMGALALLQDDHVRAAPLISESLRLFAKMSDTEAIAESLECKAWLEGIRHEPARAVRLFGAAEALREATEHPLPIFARAAYERAVDTARQALESEAFATAWEEGRSMTMEEAISYALV